MWTGKNRANRRSAGVTLMELLIALIITTIVLLAIGHLEVQRRKTQQTQESMDVLQREAQLAMYDIAKNVYNAYDIWYHDASTIYVQLVKDGALGEPPDPNKLDDGHNFQWVKYYLEGTQLRSRTDEEPNGLNIGGSGPKVLATHVTGLTFTQTEGNLCEVTFQLRDPKTDRVYVLGPLELASRPMSARPPPGWHAPLQ